MWTLVIQKIINGLQPIIKCHQGVATRKVHTNQHVKNHTQCPLNGSDKACLGRWVWTCYQGKQNLALQVITTYRPSIKNVRGVQTIYRQQQPYLYRTKDDRSLLYTIIEDLWTYISQWRELGDQIVLTIELNCNITSDNVTEIFANIGLTETITHQHRATDLVPTYQSWSHPIYSIYTSSTLKVSSGGYIKSGIITSYHHLLWLKIELNFAFSTKMDTLVPHTARMLNFQKPNTLKRFV